MSAPIAEKRVVPPEYYAGLSIARNGDPPQHDRRALPGLEPPAFTPAAFTPREPPLRRAQPRAGEAAEGRERRQLPPLAGAAGAFAGDARPRRDRERDDG